MFSHVMVGSNDIARSKVFYDAVLGALGAPPGVTDPKGRLMYSNGGAFFMVSTPLNGSPACGANGGTIGFAAASPAAADAWHAAGVAHGGQAVEDPPGPRPFGEGQIYLAYLRDPDGNKLCVLHPLRG